MQREVKYGLRPFTPATGVRIPLETPNITTTQPLLALNEDGHSPFFEIPFLCPQKRDFLFVVAQTS